MTVLNLITIPALAALGLGAFLTGLTELKAGREAARSLAEVLALSGDGLSVEPALSPGLRRVQMDLCLRLPQDPVAQVFPPASVAALSQACQARASAILADAPTSGAARAVLAMTTGAGDLARSREAAPFEGWLAGHRFALAQGLADPPVYFGIGADAALLISMGRADEVALAYVASRSMRGALAPDLALMPEADKRRFLAAAAVRAEGGQDGF